MSKKNNDPFGFLIFVGIALIFLQGFGAAMPVFFIYFILKAFQGNRDSRRANRNERRERRSQQRDYRRRDTDFERTNDRRTRTTRTTRQRTERRAERPTQRPTRQVRKTTAKDNPYKRSGMEKYKEYDYKGAIEDFEKALTINDTDIATHFNIACAYSIQEEKDKAFYHLSKAVENGFTDFEKIKTHDALAFLRIQDDFESFAQNGYQLKNNNVGKQEKIAENNDLLEQLNKLAELREKGLLTEEEFVMQKRKLLE